MMNCINAISCVLVLLCIFTALFLLAQWARPRISMSGFSDAHLHRLILAQTTHTRYIPMIHSFKYELFYFGIDLDALEGQSTFNWNRWGLFSLWDHDFMFSMDSTDKKLDLRDRVMHALDGMGVDSSVVGKIILVTTPRVLGYAFNPLNTYYCYSNVDPFKLEAVILEVNNTFKERHLYLCDHRNAELKPKHGYVLKMLIHSGMTRVMLSSDRSMSPLLIIDLEGTSHN